MGLSEKPVAEATLLAIEEINQQGGILGRRIEPISVDPRSDDQVFAEEAERLITREGVSTLFGCWTSSSRKSVELVVEKHNHLLFYPVQYEGLEQSPNVVYTGALPNQQIIPAVKWSFDNLGRKFFLVGSDYVFPRTANSIIKDQLAALQGEVIGEEYVLLGSHDLDGIVRKILQARPSVILNTLNGDSNIYFFQALRKAGITPARIPTMSFSIGENELAALDPSQIAGDYAAGNYFQSIRSVENTQFVRRFRGKYGQKRVTSDPMESAYFGVHLWAQAVRDAGTSEARDIRSAVGEQSMVAPEGLVYIDRKTQHTWKTARIGRVRADGQFDILWTSDFPIQPVPYPVYRFRSDWDDFLSSLYEGWGEHWANPGTS
jgi:urea transport system substrate-binding protein